jgi:hypothetical protein
VYAKFFVFFANSKRKVIICRKDMYKNRNLPIQLRKQISLFSKKLPEKRCSLNAQDFYLNDYDFCHPLIKRHNKNPT